MMFIFISLLMFIDLSFAQVATSSFDRTTFVINPAANTTRTFSYFSLTYSQRDMDTKIDEELSDDFSVTWKEKTLLRKEDLRIALTARKRWFIDFYLGFYQGSRDLKPDGSSTVKNSTSMNASDNILSISYKLFPFMGIGFKLGSPSFINNLSSSITYSDGAKYSSKAFVEQRTFSSAVGANLRIPGGLFFGGYYSVDQERFVNKYNNLDYLGNKTSETEKLTSTVNRRGYGAGILVGDSRKHGLRFEAAQSLMNIPKNKNFALSGKDAEEIRLAAEISYHGLSAGVSSRQTTFGYYDQSDYVDRFFSEQAASKKYTTKFGAFVNLSSDKGNSFGLSWFSYTTSGKRMFNRQEQEATDKITSFNVSYSYLF